MLPTIYIGQLALSTYWIMFVVGVISMLIIMLHRKAPFRLNTWQAIVFTLCLMVCGVTGTKILYALESIGDILAGTYISGGMSLFGAVFLIPLVMPAVGKLFSMKSSETRDACAPCLAAMVAMLRFGCFFAGCCGGINTSIGSISIQWPTQLIDSLVNVSLMVWLLCLEQEKKHIGLLYPIFMLCYSTMRFFIEFLRDTPKDWLFLSHGQWFALAAVCVSMSWLVFSRKHQKGNHYDRNIK